MDSTPDPLQDIDGRYARLLAELDALNSQVEAALEEHTHRGNAAE